MKKIFLSISCCILLLLGGCIDSGEGNQESVDWHASSEQYRHLSEEALRFCRQHGLNDQFYILIDLGIHSGRKRFFVWNFNQDDISARYMVSHGCCHFGWSGTESKDNAIVSNQDGSHCSSVGKYILSDRGSSNWGVRIKYLMHGMEGSNNNALRRQIVFHSWEAVPDEEVYPEGTPEGWGCPAVSNAAFTEIDQKIRASGKKVLMWVIR